MAPAQAASPGEAGGAARLVVMGVIAGAISITLAAAAYAFVSRGVDEAMLCLTGAAGLSALFIPLVLQRRFSIVEPIVYVAFIQIVGFAFKTIYVVFSEGDRAELLIRFGRAPSFFLNGAFWTLVGFGALAFGYLAASRRVPLERFRLFQASEWSPARLWVLVLGMIGVAALSTLTYVTLMQVSFADLNSLSSKRFYEIEGSETGYGTLGYLVTGARLAEYASYILYGYIVTTKRRLMSVYGLFLGLAVVVASVVPIVGNSRQSTVLIFINLFILSVVLRRGISVKNTVAVALIAVVMLSSLTALRRNSSDQIGGNVSSNFLVEEIIGSRHFGDFTRTAHIMNAVPDQLDYRYGSTLVGWVVAPIPRVLWKGKPFLGVEKEVASKVFGFRDRTGVPPGFIAEIVINFGPFAIPLFMFGAGWFMKVFYLSFKPVLTTLPGAVLYVALLYTVTFTFLNNELTVMVTRALAVGGPMLLMLWFLSYRRRARTLRSARRVRRRSPSYA